MKSMRTACVLAVVAFVAADVSAQTAPPPLPPALAPALPPSMPANAAPPPLPAAGAMPAETRSAAPQSAATPPVSEEYRGGTEDEPQVTTIRKDNETVDEVRVGGELRYVRVTPRRGRPYYLVPSGNGRTFNRMDSLGSGLSVPMWMLFSW